MITLGIPSNIFILFVLTYRILFGRYHWDGSDRDMNYALRKSLCLLAFPRFSYFQDKLPFRYIILFRLFHAASRYNFSILFSTFIFFLYNISLLVWREFCCSSVVRLSILYSFLDVHSRYIPQPSILQLILIFFILLSPKRFPILWRKKYTHCVIFIPRINPEPELYW